MYKLICQKPAHFLSAQMAVMNLGYITLATTPLKFLFIEFGLNLLKKRKCQTRLNTDKESKKEVEQPTFLLSAKDQGSVNMCHKISFIMIHYCFGTYIFGSKETHFLLASKSEKP